MTEIVQCRMCHLQFPGEECSRGRGICAAAKEEACTTGRIFKSKLGAGGRRKGREADGDVSATVKKEGPYFTTGSLSPGTTDISMLIIGHNEN